MVSSVRTLVRIYLSDASLVIIDWFMQIYVTDPTMSSERIEIQWYSRQKSLLPNIKAGYILLIKGLRVCLQHFFFRGIGDR